jgi:hypothetical protein
MLEFAATLLASVEPRKEKLMYRSILAAAFLTAVVAVWPGVSNTQVSCASYMETIREQLNEVPEGRKAKAMEHFMAAEKAKAENDEDTCIEELHLADGEIKAL